MTLVVLLGAATGLAVWAMIDAMFPALPRLSAALAALNTTTVAAPPLPTGTTPAEDIPAWMRRLVGPALALLRRVGLPRPGTRNDLALLERDPAAHLAAQLAAAATGLLIPPALGTIAVLAGLPVGWILPAWVGLACAAAGFAAPEISLRTEATRRRAELRHALSALLDLVVISLSGGAGVEQSLTDASRIGTSWGMRRLRAAIDAAALARVPPWRTLRQLGLDTGIPELQELASAISLAGGEGARVRTALTARAEALRIRQAGELEADAKSANQRMTIPLMLLGLCYLLFLLYPALEAVKAAL